MFLVRWFQGLLSWLGLANKSGKILFLGLDNAGKTTLMRMLKDGRLALHAPTQHACTEEVQLGNLKFTAFDLGGHLQVRRMWKQYYGSVDAVVFLVDAADVTRLPEAKQELDALLTSDELQNVPFLVLGNKVDIPTALPENELRTALGLHNLTTGKDARTSLGGMRPVEIFMASVQNRFGYPDGFRWLGNYLK